MILDINHLCSTDRGSSGSPILNLSNYKVFGVHKEAHKFYNVGTFLRYPIREYLENKNIIIKDSKSI